MNKYKKKERTSGKNIVKKWRRKWEQKNKEDSSGQRINLGKHMRHTIKKELGKYEKRAQEEMRT